MKTKSIVTFDPETLETQLLSLLKDNFRPTLGIVFCSPAQDFQAIMSIFKQYKIELMGCTSAGEIVNDEVHESAIACMLLELPQDYYRMAFISHNELNGDEYAAAQKVRAFADECFKNPAIIAVTGGVNNDGERSVSGLKNEKEIMIFGGMAGDDLEIKATYVFNTERYSDEGIAALILNNDKVEVKGLATSGWQTIGAAHTITKANGNILEKINDQPALDFFLKFFGYYDGTNGKGKSVSTISAQYPFQIQRGNDSIVLRVPLKAIEEKRAFQMIGAVHKGDKFKFSISPGVHVAEQTVEEFNSFKEKIETPDALLLFSCKGRHAALGPFLEDEVRGIYEHWNKPMLGFLSYGEFGNLKNGICEFHNETCCLVTLRIKM